MEPTWPFADPPNVATITIRSIVDGSHPILFVSHDADDGCWQFLDGAEAHDLRHAMVLGLNEIVALDSSVLELADLPLGWCAWRVGPLRPWERSERSR